MVETFESSETNAEFSDLLKRSEEERNKLCPPLESRLAQFDGDQLETGVVKASVGPVGDGGQFDGMTVEQIEMLWLRCAGTAALRTKPGGRQ